MFKPLHKTCVCKISCYAYCTFSFCLLRDFVYPCQIVAFDVHVLAGKLKFYSDAFLPALELQ